MIMITVGSFVDIVLISETPANEIHTRWIRLRESHLVYRMGDDVAEPYLLWKVVMILTPVLLVQIVDKKRGEYLEYHVG
jgi:hypothetical protein